MLVFGGCLTRSMMQSYASAAKLRGGGPILCGGIKAMPGYGAPPPRTVIGDLSQYADRAETPSRMWWKFTNGDLRRVEVSGLSGEVNELGWPFC